ncbi:MAG: glycosyltransferase family 87 protein [Bacteroidia bacterium]
MTKRRYSISNIILILIGAILVFELIRDSMREGDFIGYVTAGNAVLHHQNIYSDYLNTWPPFFSVFSVLLAIGDHLSSFFIRFIWLFGSIISMYYIVKKSVEMIFKKPLVYMRGDNGIIIQDLLIIIPLLIILRFIMDNLANVQINIFILLCALLCITFFIKKKFVWVGFLLGLIISLKVYPLFFLFYFLYKREFKPVIWTILFLLLFNSICILVFGFEQAAQYYQHWISDVAPHSYLANHKNQSIFGALLRLFTSEDAGHNLFVNILNVKPYIIKGITYVVIIVASILPAFLFRKKLKETSNLNAILEYSLIFTAIPLLSPVSWKAYFIFLWIPYLLLYAILFRVNTQLKKTTLNLLKYLFVLSVILNVCSTAGIVGSHFSCLMEAYSAITFGTILLLCIQLFVVIRIEKFDLGTILFETPPNKK